MYKVVLSICDSLLKDHVCNHEDYEDIVNKHDMLGLLQCIKKLCIRMVMITHMGYNHVVAITNYYRLSRKGSNH